MIRNPFANLPSIFTQPLVRRQADIFSSINGMTIVNRNNFKVVDDRDSITINNTGLDAQGIEAIVEKVIEEEHEKHGTCAAPPVQQSPRPKQVRVKRTSKKSS